MLKILGVNLLLLFFTGCGAIQTDRFYVEKVSAVELSVHESLMNDLRDNQTSSPNEEFILAGHRMTRGTSVAIAIREFSSGKLFSVDQGGYRKVTIFLPFSVIRKGTYDVTANRGVWAYASVGNPSFSRGGCWSYAKSGNVRITDISQESISAEIDLDFGKLRPNCLDFRLTTNALFVRKSIDHLTPWEGSPGTTVSDEGFRH